MLPPCSDSIQYSTALNQAVSYARTSLVQQAVTDGVPVPDVDMTALLSERANLSFGVVADLLAGEAFRHRHHVAKVTAALLPLVGNEKASGRLQAAAAQMTS